MPHELLKAVSLRPLSMISRGWMGPAHVVRGGWGRMPDGLSYAQACGPCPPYVPFAFCLLPKAVFMSSMYAACATSACAPATRAPARRTKALWEAAYGKSVPFYPPRSVCSARCVQAPFRAFALS